MMLAGAGVAVGVMSEILVGSITEASETIGLSPFFVGVIVVAIVGNAAEHWVAIYFAARDKMDLAVDIAIGSSAQIALFAAPVLVLVSLFLGPFPMSLVFNGLELGAIFLAILIAQAVTHEGESTWFEGFQLLSVYVVLALTFYFVMSGVLPWVALAGLTVFLLWVDLHFFARGREPTFREGVIWSIGWLVISLLAGVSLLFLDAHGTEDFITYTTVYFIERSLSLDNLFVFLLLFAYFGVPTEHRARLLFWGIAAALVMRGLAILGGVALLEQLHFFIYILGVLLLFLAYRILRGVEDNVDPDNNFVVKLVRRVFPVTGEYHGKHWFVKQEGTRYATPMFVCLAAIVAADIAFAVDSIPAAFAITRDSVLIWMANIFALLGLRALFVLVEGLIRRFRYLDETIAIVLGIVAIKLLAEDLYKVGPVMTLVVVFVAFTIGIVASLIADKRDPDSDAKREERTESLAGSGPPSSD